VRNPTLVGRIARTGLRKGVLQGSRPWLYTGMVALALRLAHRVVREEPRTVFSEDLEPGQRLEIRVLPPER
jgi:hypothetical protein